MVKGKHRVHSWRLKGHVKGGHRVSLSHCSYSEAAHSALVLLASGASPGSYGGMLERMVKRNDDG
jgi:hypothetical protein